MLAANPLVPPAVGQPAAGSAPPVANTPATDSGVRPETPRPVGASKDSDRARHEAPRRGDRANEAPSRAANGGEERGSRLDIVV